MDIDRLILDSNHNMEYLSDCLKDVTDSQSKLIPAPGKWSIHQLLEHVYISETAVFELCSVEGTPTERSPFEKIIAIRNYFGDHTQQYISMDMLCPENCNKSTYELIDSIRQIRTKLIQEGSTTSWSDEYTAFKHPLLGSMTRYEWVYFNIYHLDRHTHQMRSIKLMPEISGV